MSLAEIKRKIVMRYDAIKAIVIFLVRFDSLSAALAAVAIEEYMNDSNLKEVAGYYAIRHQEREKDKASERK